MTVNPALYRSANETAYPAALLLSGANSTAYRMWRSSRDGEIVCLDGSGRPHFYDLLFRRPEPYLYASDILWLNGEDLRDRPFIERKSILRRMIGRRPSRLLYADHLARVGSDLFEKICLLDLEAVVAKPANSRYHVIPKRPAWVKIKNPTYSQAEGRADSSRILASRCYLLTGHTSGDDSMRSSQFTLSVAISCIVAAFTCCLAQTPSVAERSRNTFTVDRSTSAPVDAPRVNLDRTVAFRLRAPAASKVEVVIVPDEPRPLVKGTDGVWSVTVGPLEPEIYRYRFVVDGFSVPDMSNSNLNIGRSSADNYLEVPGTPPRFDEVQDVPQGALHIRDYSSKVFNARRRLNVYVPPQYDSDARRRFPVLYLRHGDGGLETYWSGIGRAGVILDNLLAQRKAVPMIIVMPNGYPGFLGDGMTEAGTIETTRELMTDIIPFVEKNYRVLSDRQSRAIAGYSMGGGQAFLTGLQNIESFAWIAEFSAGLVSDVNFRLENAVPGFLMDASRVNSQLRLLFISCGTEDPRYAGHLDLVDLLQKSNIRHQWYSTPGAHEWKVWRHSLAELLPKLFQTAAPKQQ